MATRLATELATYERNRDALIGRAENKFVLIKDADVVDVYDAAADAIREGYRRFGNVPFLVKQVARVEVPVEFASNLIAV